MISEFYTLRDQLHDVSKKRLRETFKDKNEDWFSEFFRLISEDAWFQKLEQNEVKRLYLRVFSALPSNLCPNLVATVYYRVMCEFLSVPQANLTEALGQLNPKLSEQFFTLNPVCPKEELLIIFKHAIKEKLTHFIHLFLQDPPLDHTIKHCGDLLSCVLEESDIKTLEIILDHFIKRYGVIYLENLLKAKPNSIRFFIQRNGSDSWIKLVELFRSKGIKRFPVIDILNDIAPYILLEFYDDPAKDNFEQVIEMLIESGIELAKLLSTKVRNLSGNILDLACRHEKTEFLRVLLKYMSNQDKSQFLYTNLHGVGWFRGQWEDHCKSEAHQLIDQEENCLESDKLFDDFDFDQKIRLFPTPEN